MAKDSSVAPKERINVVYESSAGGAQEDVELPLKLMVLGDFTQQEDETPVEDRKVINIDKNNFNNVLGAQNLNLSFVVENTLTEEKNEDIGVDLKFDNMKDFEPESIVNQVPELKKLLELREALTTLKGPMGNVPAFRKLLQSLVSDEAAREKLLKELEAGEAESNAAADK